MRAFSRNRRKLIKPHYVRGLKKTMTGTSKVLLESSVKAHIPYIEVMGNTVQNGTPTPETPIPIENANDDGMSVILRGENLFNAQGGRSYEIHISEFSFGNNFIKKKNTRTAGEDRIIFSNQYPSGTYTLSFKSKYSFEGWYSVRLMCTKTFTGGTYNSVYKAYYKDIASNTDPDVTYSFTVNDTFEIGFGFNTTSASGYGTMELYDITLTPTSQAVEYKPYFEETIEIPTEITSTVDKPIIRDGVALADGKSVPIVLAKYVSARPQSYPEILYDKITVDRVSSKVIYNSYTVKHSITGTEKSISTGGDAWYSSQKGHVMAYASILIGTEVKTPYGYCNQFTLEHYTGALKDNHFANSTVIIFKLPGTPSLDEYKTFFQQQYEKGTPVEIQLPRKKPIEYDISNTDLGQALLSLATRQGANYLEIVGDLEPSALNVTYYSESEQDQVNLTIKYMCEGREIKEPRVQEIRKGSKYLIVAPHINGYTRISSEVYGVADENTTIELIYKEEEDATI